MKNLFKKIFIILGIVGAITCSATLACPSTYAQDEEGDSVSRELGSCDSFLGLTSWDCGLTSIGSEEELKMNIWIIIGNIATDITVIAAYLILGFVIYGGYQYTFSGGDAGKVSNGKKTLTQAFIGLAIVMSANVIMNIIRTVLVGGKFKDCVSGQCIDPNVMVQNTISWVIGIAGIVSVIFLVYGGIQYMTSAGDANKTKKAKDTILYAVIGLIIVALSTIITAFVSNLIKNANNNAYLNQTTISKEVTDENIN